MRRVFRAMKTVRLAPVRTVMGAYGAVFEAETGAGERIFRASVQPIDLRVWRDTRTRRPLLRITLVPDSAVPVRQGDHLYVEGYQRPFRATEVRAYPIHQEIEAEALP